MIVAITRMNRVVHQSSVHSVNSDVWMEIASLEAGAVMGSVTVKMTLMKQDALPLYQMGVATSSLAITHDVSRNDLSAILMMIVETVQTNMQTAHNQLAGPLSLPATTSAVF